MVKILPDFLIIGAAKAGTSSLHLILDEHPEIYLPPREVFFFDRDDPQQHGDFFSPSAGEKGCPEFNNNLSEYEQFFDEAGPDQLVGEDSTTYLASRKAPERIKTALPGVKLLALLRDPVERTYSQYWHGFNTGRTSLTFDQHLASNLFNLVNRGHYREQLQRYLDYFPRTQLKIIVFERFIQKMQPMIDEVLEFLGLNQGLDLSEIETHRNPTGYPRSWWLQKITNIIAGPISPRGHAPEKTRPTSFFKKILRKIVMRLNLSQNVEKPPMNSSAREFLETYFNEKNRGLSELIGRDFSKYWPWFNE